MSSLADSSSSSSSSASSAKRKFDAEIDVSQVAASVAARQSAKRYKEMPPCDFRVTVSPSSNLTKMVNTLEALLTEVTFNITKTSNFSGIRVDATSPDLCCMVKAKLACTVTLSENIGNKTGFSVNVKEMKPIMKAVEGAVDIVRYKNNDHLTFECANHIPMRTFNLPTIVMEEAEERLFDITTQFTIQMPCVALKDFTRRSVDFGSETVRMEVSNFKATDGTTHAFFAMSCHDGVIEKAKFTYHSETKSSEARNGQQIVCDGSGGVTKDAVYRMAEQAKTEYLAEFQASYITDFLKSFDRGEVFMSLAQKDGEAGPLILHQSLGSDQSYMRLVLAPKMQEPDDM